MRARWDGHRLLTRNGDPIDAPRWFTAGWPAQAMDGELWIARGEFQRISDLCALETDDDAWKPVRFAAFDLPGDAGCFAQRASRLRELVVRANAPQLGAIAQTHVGDRATLDARLRGRRRRRRRAGAASRDGALPGRAQRRPAGTNPRTTPKRAWSAIAPAGGKYAGMVGALLVVDASGRRFALGSGLSDAQRRNPPQPGTWVTFRYNGLTAKGNPRFARFLRVREDYRLARD